MKSSMNCIAVGLALLLCVAPRCKSASLPLQQHEQPEEQSRWLDDFDIAPQRQFEEASYDVMQADSPVSEDLSQGFPSDRKSAVSLPPTDDEVLRCPPLSLPVAIIRSWCSTSRANTVHRCHDDDDCTTSSSSSPDRKQKCCHDGCSRVCTEAIDPAPYVDWKREPPTRLASGKTWLVQGPDEPPQVEWCSTSYTLDDVTSDEEPLLCPTGYTCYIDEPGDVINGIPNRGHCVAESVDFTSDTFKMASLSQHKSVNGSCSVSKVTYDNGETFKYGKHTCKCEDGSVMCSVSQINR